MRYSIEINFDEKSDLIIRDIWKKLRERNVSAYMDKHGGLPHITLAIFDSSDSLVEEELIRKTAENESSFTIKMSSLGIFPGDENIIFLSPVPSKKLIDFHFKLQLILKDIKGNVDYYKPDNWVPHCTLGMDIRKSKIDQAMDLILEDFKPLEVKVESLKLVKFSKPREVKTFKLKE